MITLVFERANLSLQVFLLKRPLLRTIVDLFDSILPIDSCCCKLKLEAIALILTLFLVLDTRLLFLIKQLAQFIRLSLDLVYLVSAALLLILDFVLSALQAFYHICYLLVLQQHLLHLSLTFLLPLFLLALPIVYLALARILFFALLLLQLV